LQVNATATLGGTLSVIDAPGFIPPPASKYAVVTDASHTGCFATINGDFVIVYQPTDVLAEASWRPRDLLAAVGDVAAR
jgi:hypothetical protein